MLRLTRGLSRDQWEPDQMLTRFGPWAHTHLDPWPRHRSTTMVDNAFAPGKCVLSQTAILIFDQQHSIAQNIHSYFTYRPDILWKLYIFDVEASSKLKWSSVLTLRSFLSRRDTKSGGLMKFHSGGLIVAKKQFSMMLFVCTISLNWWWHFNL